MKRAILTLAVLAAICSTATAAILASPTPGESPRTMTAPAKLGATEVVDTGRQPVPATRLAKHQAPIASAPQAPIASVPDQQNASVAEPLQEVVTTPARAEPLRPTAVPRRPAADIPTREAVSRGGYSSVRPQTCDESGCLR